MDMANREGQPDRGTAVLDSLSFTFHFQVFQIWFVGS